MKTITISGVTVTYPDTLVFASDVNWVEFAGSTSLGEVSVQIASAYANTERLVYATTMNTLRMMIGSALMPHLEGSGLDMAKVYLTFEVAGSSQQVTAYVRYGWTLGTRTHYAEGTVLYHSDATQVSVFVPSAGGATIHGGIRDGERVTTSEPDTVSVPTDAHSVTIDTISSWILKVKITKSGEPGYPNTYSLIPTGNTALYDGSTYDEYNYDLGGGIYGTCYVEQYSGIPTAERDAYDQNWIVVGVIDSVTTTGTTVRRGEMGYNYTNAITRWDVTLRRTCALEREIMVGWYNTDGVWRVASGQLLTGSLTSGGDPMRRSGGALRHEAWRHITSVGQTISVGFFDVPHDAYIEDILTSWYVAVIMPDNTEIPAVPTTKKIDNTEGGDVIIELEVQE